jgi:threonyl-tRNA synthetase
MIHRALMGSLERFFGILIEHYAGVFPLWLAPVQASVLTISERQEGFARAICDQLRAAGFRAELDADNEKIGYKIRRATVRKIPNLLIIGDKEVADGQVTVRLRNGDNVGPYAIEQFIDILRQTVQRKQ